MRTLRKRQTDFLKQNNEDALYDVDFDRVLIEQSIATQYGVLPDAQGELSYPVWSKLVSGLMEETPLGRIVRIRAEEDRKVIAKMTPWQRQIRSEWQAFKAKKQGEKTPEMLRQEMAQLEKMLAQAFGGGRNA